MSSPSKRLKKNRKRHKPYPPLPWWDKGIYFAAAILGGLLLYVAALFGVNGRFTRFFALLDPGAVAASGHFSNGLQVLLFLYLGISGLVVWQYYYSTATPIFGNKKISYGMAPWEPTIYPLTDPRRKRIFATKNKRMLRHFTWKMWGVGLAVVIVLSAFGLFGRNVLQEDFTLLDYNCINLPVHTYTQEEFDTLTLGVESYHRSRSLTNHYRCYAVLVMQDGRKYRFLSSDFRSQPGEYRWISQMTKLKALYDREDVTLEGMEKLPALLEDYQFSSQSRQDLFQLFT